MTQIEINSETDQLLNADDIMNYLLPTCNPPSPFSLFDSSTFCALPLDNQLQQPTDTSSWTQELSQHSTPEQYNIIPTKLLHIQEQMDQLRHDLEQPNHCAMNMACASGFVSSLV